MADDSADLSGLPTDQELEEMIEPRPSVVCGLCETANADVECLQCQVPLCSNCSDYLHQKGMYKQHTLTPVSRTGTRPLRRCAEHGKELDLYCVDDEVIVCAHCLLVGKYQNHKCISLSEASKRCKEDVSVSKDVVTGKSKAYSEAKEVLEARVPEVHRKFAEGTEAIVDRFAELRAILDERERDMVEQMCTVRDAKLYLLTRQIAELDVILDRASVCLGDADRYMGVWDNTETIEGFKNLIGRLESLSAVECDTDPKADDSYTFAFEDTVDKAAAGYGSVDLSIITSEISDAIRAQAIEIERQRLSRDDASSISNNEDIAADASSLGTVPAPAQVQSSATSAASVSIPTTGSATSFRSQSSQQQQQQQQQVNGWQNGAVVPNAARAPQQQQAQQQQNWSGNGVVGARPGVFAGGRIR